MNRLLVGHQFDQGRSRSDPASGSDLRRQPPSARAKKAGHSHQRKSHGDSALGASSPAEPIDDGKRRCVGAYSHGVAAHHNRTPHRLRYQRRQMRWLGAGGRLLDPDRGMQTGWRHQWAGGSLAGNDSSPHSSTRLSPLGATFVGGPGRISRATPAQAAASRTIVRIQVLGLIVTPNGRGRLPGSERHGFPRQSPRSTSRV